MSPGRLELPGNHRENRTIDLPCRTVWQSGHNPVKVIGPVDETESEIAVRHRDFWRHPAG